MLQRTGEPSEGETASVVLEAVGISRSFGDEQVLEDLSLRVEPGEILAVIGPSGVGKTTLLRTLSLTEEPEAGTVLVSGTDAWAVEEADRLALRRRIGMVFQEANLFDATVARNVAYGLRVRRSWTERIQGELRAILETNGTAGAVREALEVVGLAENLDQRARSLSGGEAQRVSFARALAYDPDVLLLDEPTSELDPRNTSVLEDAIREARDRGIGVVVATHDMHQAQRVADRVGVLLDGEMAEVGPTRRIFESPDNERTRQFVSGELVY